MNSKNNISKLINYIMIALIPLILYGFYKNGIIPFAKGYGNIFDLFKPIIFPVLGFTFGYGYNLKLAKNKNPFSQLYCLIVAMLIPAGANILVLLITLGILLVLINFISQKQSINKIALTMLIVLILLSFFNEIPFMNVYEKSVNSAYDLLDIIMGRNYAGISSSSIILAILGYGLLCFNDTYKKDIPLYIIGVYLFCIIFASIISKTFDLKIILNSYIFFGAIFIATDSANSPYTKMGKMIYGILIGLLTFLLSRIIIVEISLFIAIIIGSLFKKYFDKTYELYLN